MNKNSAYFFIFINNKILLFINNSPLNFFFLYILIPLFIFSYSILILKLIDYYLYNIYYQI